MSLTEIICAVIGFNAFVAMAMLGPMIWHKTQDWRLRRNIQARAAQRQAKQTTEQR